MREFLKKILVAYVKRYGKPWPCLPCASDRDTFGENPDPSCPLCHGTGLVKVAPRWLNPLAQWARGF